MFQRLFILAFLAAAAGRADAAWQAPRPVELQLQSNEVIVDAAFSFDGSRIVTASHYAAVLRNAATGEVIREYKSTMWWNPFATRPDLLSVAFSPDGKRIAGGQADGLIIIWDAETGKIRQSFEGEGAVRWVAFSEDGVSVMARDGDHGVRMWMPGSNRPISSFEPSNRGRAVGAAFTAKGPRAVITWGKDSRIVDPVSHKFLWDLSGSSEINSASFSADGRYLSITRVYSADFQMVNLVTGQIMTLESRSGALAVLNPDASRLVSCASDGEALIWDLETGAAIHKFQISKYPAKLILSANGKLLAAIDNSGAAQIWDVDPPELEQSEVQRKINENRRRLSVPAVPDSKHSAEESFRLLWNTIPPLLVH